MKLDESLSALIEPMQNYVQDSIAGNKPAIHLTPMPEIAEKLQVRHWVDQGGMDVAALKMFTDHFLAETTRLRSPGFLAHQTGVSTSGGIIGALLDGMVNNPMNIYEMGPATASIEYVLINWMLEKAGWQPAPWPQDIDEKTVSGAGALTHGGSLGNLTAILAARTQAAPEAWEEGVSDDLILLATQHSHYSVARSAGLLGLGRKQIVAVETDDNGVIMPDSLPDVIQTQRSQGKRIIALIANACATAAGLFDPLRAIGEVCQAEGVWLHVDGAHGASVLLSEKLSGLMDGIELADSLIWDAHKMMQTPPLCTAVLVKNSKTLDQAFEQEGSYIFHDKKQPGFDFIGRTVECTRAGQALKLFLSLAEKGEKGLAQDLEAQTAFAQTVYRWIEQQPDVSSPVFPESNIICFSIDQADPIQIRDALIEDGEFHLSTTQYKNQRFLRMVFMHNHTRLSDIERLFTKIRALIQSAHP